MSRDSQYIHKSHNVTVLLYHIVSSAKYRRVVISSEVDQVLVSVCEEIEKRYEIRFLEIGTDKEHVHFLIQSVPSYSVTKIVRTIKSLIAKEVFKQCPEVKEKLWEVNFGERAFLQIQLVNMELKGRLLNILRIRALPRVSINV